jgi:hypothetical protein
LAISKLLVKIMIRKHSIKRSRVESSLRRVERELKQNPSSSRCFFYPSEPRSCFDHIVPKSHNASLIDKRENLIPIGVTAHDIITFGTAEQVKSLPRINEYLRRMKALDESYYNRFLINRNIEL